MNLKQKIVGLSSCIFIVAFFVAITVESAFADGMLIPPPDIPMRDAFAIKYHRVTIDINDGVVKTSVDQVFKNLTGRRIEADYVFPIPQGAALDNFAMYVGGERLEGKILNAGEARDIYENIVRQQLDPALLEYVGNNAFKARVFPIEPNEEKRIELSYTQVLAADNGVYEYVYPLNTEKFSARMIDEVTVSGKIATGVPLKTIYSPSHNISVNRPNDNSASFSFEERNVRPSIDFVLYYTVDQREVGTTVMAYDADDAENGFFMATIAPRVESDSAKVVAKNFIFVLDKSGSMMDDDKISQAKEALRFVLRSLNEGDRFNVIAYSDSLFECFTGGMKTYSSHSRDEALDFVKGFDADGGTNINDALLRAIEMLKTEGGSKPNYIVFLTDGLPTVGVTDETEIQRNVANANRVNARIFNFGVGYDVNTHLLDKLAEQNHGVTEYVRPSEGIEVKVSSFFGKISNPVLTNVKIDFKGVKTSDVYPADMPDLFKGSQIIIVGRYQTGVKGSTVELTGTVDGKTKNFSYPVSFNSKSSYSFIPRLWAARKIGYLNDEIRLQGSNQELINEIIRLSKRYGIITEYTSFLVREEGFFADDEEKERAFDMAAAPLQDAKSGAGAVGQSQQNQQLKGNTPGAVQGGVNAPNAYYDAAGESVQVHNIKYIDDLTFFLVDDYWTDSRFDPDKQKIVEVKAFTQAYFDILTANPKIGKYVSLGSQVIIQLDDDEALKISGETGSESLPQSHIDTIGKQIAKSLNGTMLAGNGSSGSKTNSNGENGTSNGLKVASDSSRGGSWFSTALLVAVFAFIGYRLLNGKSC